LYSTLVFSSSFWLTARKTGKHFYSVEARLA
jgi:hypothetical protein